ncbi:MAG: hypothetical protein IIA41_10125, partial [SAR324 cluster bacterium]|nr:hypothetical protein [SAR324 cluster bacterium]
MCRYGLTWLAILAAFGLLFAGCDTSSSSKSKPPDLTGSPIYWIEDDGSVQPLTLGATEFRVDDADGSNFIWGTVGAATSGFLKLTITNVASGLADPPPVGLILYGVEVADGFLFMVADSDYNINPNSGATDTTLMAYTDFLVGLNLEGPCPTIPDHR